MPASQVSRRMIAITPPCMECGHTRVLHERQHEPEPDFPCLFDPCRCEQYLAKKVMYVWVESERSAREGAA